VERRFVWLEALWGQVEIHIHDHVLADIDHCRGLRLADQLVQGEMMIDSFLAIDLILG
jgi:hypothetical protein